MRRILVAGNWKMNANQAMVSSLLSDIVAGSPDKVDVAVFPPAVYLSQAIAALQNTSIAVGGQNINANVSGAYTGEIAANMLVDIGCSMALVGHSERRTLFGETDQDVLAKVQAALAAQLTPVICIGETLEEREQGTTEQVIANQVNAVLEGLSSDQLAKCVWAYEPVWAIGTGKTATPDQAQQVHQFVRQLLAAKDAEVAQKVRILYGGSVNPQSAADLFAQADIDGGLVGGASLKAEQFLAICNSVNE